MSWTEVFQQFSTARQPNGQFDSDGIRGKYIQNLVNHTGRPLIIYASAFLEPTKASLPSQLLMLTTGDKEGLIEVLSGLPGDKVDVFVHSPGGTAEGAESFVHILRDKFKDIRFIVPMAAKSAATMLVMSGDSIVMDIQSELGPIDPQFLLHRPDGAAISVPAQAILDQFEKAQNQIVKQPQLLPSWLPILQQMGPALIKQAENAISLSRDLVKEWLEKFMLKNIRDKKKAAGSIANFLSNHNNFRSHGRVIDLTRISNEPKLKPLCLLDLRKEQILQELVRDLYHALSLSFNMTGMVKLFENSAGVRVVKAIMQVMPLPQIPVQPGPPTQ